MSTRRSAGIVLVRARGGTTEVLLVHPGGPLWARKDLGAWSIPKGEYGRADDALQTARREFAEELGTACPAQELVELGTVVQPGGKHVVAWYGMGDIDTATVVSNTFEMEWPPRSGRRQTFPEIDRAEFFPMEVAAAKILSGQRPLLDSLARALLSVPGVP